ncbi:MAG: hypothetical protein JST04_13830 [Bdellovibrionales bacterium]|nr:hypothetical protein [Bdellovibrionales bacterium]
MGRCSLYLLVVVLGLAPGSAHAFGRSAPKRPCAVTIKQAQPERYRSMIADADLARSTLLPDASIKNQNKYGCCWISSTLGKWERIAEKKFGHSIVLSENHMVLASLFYRVREGIYFGSEVIQGGWQESADWMAMFMGLVPEKACKWKVDLRVDGERIVKELNQKIADYQKELVGMHARRASAETVWKFSQETKTKILRELRDEVGNFPKSFVVDGKTYTPYSFARTLADAEDEMVRVRYEPIEERVPRLPSDDEEIVKEERGLFKLYPELGRTLESMSPKFSGAENEDLYERIRLYGKTHLSGLTLSTSGGRPVNQVLDAGYREEKVSLEKMRERIDESIAAGNPVLLSTSMVHEYYRSETGVMSLRAHGATPADAKNAKFKGGHAMLVTGVYRNRYGEVVGYRIQNSWGANSGVGGYYLMDADYFNAFVTGIVVKSKT